MHVHRCVHGGKPVYIEFYVSAHINVCVREFTVHVYVYACVGVCARLNIKNNKNNNNNHLYEFFGECIYTCGDSNL